MVSGAGGAASGQGGGRLPKPGVAWDSGPQGAAGGWGIFQGARPFLLSRAISILRQPRMWAQGSVLFHRPWDRRVLERLTVAK